MITYALGALAAVGCFAAAIFMVAGLNAGLDVTKGRRAGRGLASAGFMLLGARLVYLLAFDEMRINIVSLIGMAFIGLGTAAIWADIVDHDEEERASRLGGLHR